MSFGSQAVFIWFIYLLGASSILGLSHSEKAWAVILAQGGVRVPELKLRNVSVPTPGACGLARHRAGPASPPGCLPSNRRRPSGSGPSHTRICCSQKRKRALPFPLETFSSGWGRASSSPQATPPSIAPCEPHGGHVVQACLCIGICVVTGSVLPGS